MILPSGLPIRAIPKVGPGKGFTQNLIVALGQLGKSRGHEVCGGGCLDFGRGEWLYDLVWLKHRDGFVVDVPLILESEWSHHYSDITYDFRKLLVGRAQHRIMVFQQGPHLVEGVFRRLAEEVRTFSLTQAGDRYLLLGLTSPGGGFTHELLVASP